MSGQHAFLPPSGAAIWVKCAAAPSMWQRYPEPEDSIESMEGTAAHWAFEQLFAGQPIDVGLVAPNGVVLVEEMIEGAYLFYETVMAACGTEHPGDIRVEHTLAIPRVHGNNWGTPDAFYPEDTMLTLHLFDYKFGHEYVDEFENWQLINYAAGLFDLYQIDGKADEWTTVTMTIVQPRCYHRDGPVRRLTVRASELRGHINQLRMAAEAAHEANPVATVNPKCKHCSGRHACEPYQRSALQAADLSMRSVPLDLTPVAMGLELAMLKRAQAAMDGRISGLEASIDAQIRQGQRVPGWCLEPTEGRTAWSVPAQEVAILGDMYGVALRKDAVITPKQAEKAGIPAEIVKEYSFNPPGAQKLVPETSTQLRKIFSI